MATKYATADNPNIEAAIHGLFRFNDKEQAVQRLEAIKKFFTRSRKHPKPDNPDSTILWIRDFAVTEEEKNRAIWATTQ